MKVVQNTLALQLIWSLMISFVIFFLIFFLSIVGSCLKRSWLSYLQSPISKPLPGSNLYIHDAGWLPAPHHSPVHMKKRNDSWSVSAAFATWWSELDFEVGMHSNDWEEIRSSLFKSLARQGSCVWILKSIKKGERCVRAYSAVKILDLKVIHAFEPCKSLHCVLQPTQSWAINLHAFKL